MSVLLTDDAVREATSTDSHTARHTLELFLRYHATEGRKVLVERVSRAIAADCTSGDTWEPFTPTAEAVVTALFGKVRPS